MTLRAAASRSPRSRAARYSAEKGPAALGRRLARRAVYRKANGLLARALRRSGL